MGIFYGYLNKLNAKKNVRIRRWAKLTFEHFKFSNEKWIMKAVESFEYLEFGLRFQR